MSFVFFFKLRFETHLRICWWGVSVMCVRAGRGWRLGVVCGLATTYIRASPPAGGARRVVMTRAVCLTPRTPRPSHLRYVRRMCFADSDVVSCAHSNETTCFALWAHEITWGLNRPSRYWVNILPLYNVSGWILISTTTSMFFLCLNYQTAQFW